MRIVNYTFFTTQETSATIPVPSYTVFSIERGAKRYELTNHLGNVLVVVSDKKIPICATSVVLSYTADVVTANDYSPFGATMPGRNYNSTDYRYGAANGQEKVDEISGAGNHYTAMFWEYDPRTGRRWNVDPVVKPWQSPYACYSGNPIWRVDPNGDDDYFNSDGAFSHSTKTGTKILVCTAAGNVAFSEFTANRNHSKASANIVGHYAGAAGVNSGQTVGVSPSTKGLAYSTKNGIWVSTKGGASPLLNDFKNLINTLNHEKYHHDNNDPGKGKNMTFQDHLNVYDAQMSDGTFKETTNEFKAGMANNYAGYLLADINSGEISTDKANGLIKDFNSKYESYDLKITGKNDFGNIELKSIGLTEKGKSTGWQKVEAQEDAH